MKDHVSTRILKSVGMFLLAFSLILTSVAMNTSTKSKAWYNVMKIAEGTTRGEVDISNKFPGALRFREEEAEFVNLGQSEYTVKSAGRKYYVSPGTRKRIPIIADQKVTISGSLFRPAKYRVLIYW